MRTTIEAVLTGKVKPFRGADQPSAIHKSPASGRVAVGHLGLEGDEQADLRHHGGVDKAIHHYPFDHYHYWQKSLGALEVLSTPGAFGENISTSGVVEEAVCIGDRLRLGTALVEVSQGRQPCWKLDHRFALSGVTAAVIKTGLAGWYYRVLEPGSVAAGDELELIDRPSPEWTVARVFALLIAGQGRSDRKTLQDLRRISALAESWMARVHTLIASG